MGCKNSQTLFSYPDTTIHFWYNENSIVEEKFVHILFSVLLILFMYCDMDAFGRSVFDPRKEQTNIAQDFIFRGFDLFDDSNVPVYGFTAAFSYHHSFKDSRISQALFGNSEFGVSGSLVDGRLNGEFLADTFGLSQHFESLVTLKPVVTASKFVTLFSCYNPFFVRNTFLRIYIPLVVMTHSIGIKEETASDESETPFAAGYMGKSEVTPQHNFTDALEKPRPFGAISKLLFGKIEKHKRLTRVADIRIEYGGAVYKTRESQCLLYGILAIPTGNKNKPEHLFYPFAGTHKQVEFGLGISGHVTTHEDVLSKILFHVAVNLTSLTKRTEKRSFDLLPNGPLSRYLLVKLFDERRNPIGAAKPLINVTTLLCHAHNKIQMDGLIACTIHHNGNSGIIGYNAFLRSRDIVTVVERIKESTYGLKGIQNLFDGNTPDPTTESTATIFGTTFDNQENVADEVPQFVKNSEIDPDSAAMPFQLTNKLFVAYEWRVGNHNNQIESFLAIGTEVEFEGFNLSETVKPTKTTVNQWGLFGSVRITF